jgi:hypothetical protein
LSGRADDAGQVVEFVRGAVAQELRESEDAVHVFPVSARQALSAKLRPEPEPEPAGDELQQGGGGGGGGGFGALEDYIVRTLQVRPQLTDSAPRPAPPAAAAAACSGLAAWSVQIDYRRADSQSPRALRGGGGGGRRAEGASLSPCARAALQGPEKLRYKLESPVGVARTLVGKYERVLRARGESFMRVHWVAVPETLRARRTNRGGGAGRRRRAGAARGHAAHLQRRHEPRLRPPEGARRERAAAGETACLPACHASY